MILGVKTVIFFTRTCRVVGRHLRLTTHPPLASCPGRSGMRSGSEHNLGAMSRRWFAFTAILIGGLLKWRTTRRRLTTQDALPPSEPSAPDQGLALAELLFRRLPPIGVGVAAALVALFVSPSHADHTFFEVAAQVIAVLFLGVAFLFRPAQPPVTDAYLRRWGAGYIFFAALLMFVGEISALAALASDAPKSNPELALASIALGLGMVGTAAIMGLPVADRSSG
jgi:hypothetical protein